MNNFKKFQYHKMKKLKFYQNMFLYLIIRKGMHGYKIQNHPKCNFKQFSGPVSEPLE